ncbi:MAG TPA: SIMPL domain-containing protein [Phototrophicaceae bacterium]|nr:SIMPL domain-containing protein [Phototrophicaceae bacterium]
MNRSFLINRKSWNRAGMISLTTLALLAVAVVPALAQVPTQSGGYFPPNSITVSGSGQAGGAPDVAYVNLGVDTTSANVSDAVNAANDTMAAIIAALQEVGVAAADIQTVSFNVYPQDVFNPQTGGPTGERNYNVSNQLSVTVRDINQVSDVIQAGLNAGATSVNSLSFGVADPTDLEQEARVNAIADARQRAERLAEALGVTLGSPIIVVENLGGGTVQPMYDRVASGGVGGPQIAPGQLNVNVQVTVTFSIGE